jgi:hypothetical protein
MTKIIKIGESEEKNNKKKIKFLSYLGEDGIKYPWADNPSPSCYDFIEPICENYQDTNQDLMFIYDKGWERKHGCLVFGKFNDGVV